MCPNTDSITAREHTAVISDLWVSDWMTLTFIDKSLGAEDLGTIRPETTANRGK